MIKLRTLGGVELADGRGSELRSLLAQPKRLALLVYLASRNHHATRRRDSLVALFWPELDAAHARGALRQALSFLRRELGEKVLNGQSEEAVGFEPGAFECDAVAFEQACDDGRLTEGLERYRGDFLEGFFVSGGSLELERWIDSERARLRQCARDAARTLAERADAAGDRLAAARWAQRALALAPDDEDALRCVLRLLDRAGDRAGALRVYADFTEQLAREFGVAPSAETQRLWADVRSRDDRVPGRSVPRPPEREAVATSKSASERAGAAPAAAGGRPKLTYPVAVGAGMLLAITLAALVSFGRSAARAPAEDLVAVFPFRVSEADSSLAWLHEGIVELLTIRLASNAGPHVADPATVLTAWNHEVGVAQPDAPHDAALQVAGRLGAARLIEGSVIGTARRVTLSAWLSTGSGSNLVDRATAEGSPDSLPQLVDRLAAQLLGMSVGVEGPRLASLTSTSLPAIRAFLLGREAFRGGRVAEAVQRFRDATLLDSTFALAGIELSRAAGWTSDNEAESLGIRVALAGRDRLAPRDRAMLEVARQQWISAADIFERWNTAVRADPDRAEMWYGLGDMHYHNGPLAGEDSSFQRAAEAFRRGWELDSAAAGASALRRLPVAEPMLHLVEIAQMRHDTAEVLRLARQALSVDSTSDLARALMWHRALVTGESARRAFWREIGSARELALLYIANFITWSGVGTEDLPRAATEDARRLMTHDPGYATFILTMMAFNAGRPGDVPVIVERRDDPHQSLRDRIHQALSWDGDTAVARTAVRELSRYVDTAPMSGQLTLPQLGDICTLGVWRAARGEHDAVAQASTRLRTARLPTPTPYDSARVVHFVEVCSALLDASRASALALPDARNKVRTADSLARDYIIEICCVDAVSDANLLLARLWEQEGDLTRALAAVRRRACPFGTCPRYLSSFLREEGRLAALTGDTAAAVRAYRHYLGLRPHPSQSVSPAVEQVRRELAALRAGGTKDRSQ